MIYTLDKIVFTTGYTDTNYSDANNNLFKEYADNKYTWWRCLKLKKDASPSPHAVINAQCIIAEARICNIKNR